MAVLQKCPESFHSVLDISEYGRNFRCPSIPCAGILLLDVQVWTRNNRPVGINMVRPANINAQKPLVFPVAQHERVFVLPDFAASIRNHGEAVFFRKHRAQFKLCNASTFRKSELALLQNPLQHLNQPLRFCQRQISQVITSLCIYCRCTTKHSGAPAPAFKNRWCSTLYSCGRSADRYAISAARSSSPAACPG